MTILFHEEQHENFNEMMGRRHTLKRREGWRRRVFGVIGGMSFGFWALSGVLWNMWGSRINLYSAGGWMCPWLGTPRRI